MDYINSIANNTQKPKKKMAELETTKPYKVTGLKKVKAKHGDAVIATLDDEFIVFLPKRLVEVFKDDDVAFNVFLDFVKRNKLSLLYIGGEWNNFKFIELQEDKISEESTKQDD